MANGLDPEHMTAEERLDELAMLLATGILRLWLKRRKKRGFPRENPLELPRETGPVVTVD